MDQFLFYIILFLGLLPSVTSSNNKNKNNFGYNIPDPGYFAFVVFIENAFM